MKFKFSVDGEPVPPLDVRDDDAPALDRIVVAYPCPAAMFPGPALYAASASRVSLWNMRSRSAR